MLKAVMRRARPDVVRRPELLDVPKTLELRAARGSARGQLTHRKKQGTDVRIDDGAYSRPKRHCDSRSQRDASWTRPPQGGRRRDTHGSRE